MDHDDQLPLRLAAYKEIYLNWAYKENISRISNGWVLPQTRQTSEHEFVGPGLRRGDVYNGGVYDEAFRIVADGIQETKRDLRHVPDVVRSPPAIHERLEGTWLFGGFYHKHIGHILTESIGRLWASDEFAGSLQGIIFVCFNGNDPKLSTHLQQEYVEQVASILAKRETFAGIVKTLSRLDRIHLVGPAVQVEDLIVPSQMMGLLPYGSLMGGHPRFRKFIRSRVEDASAALGIGSTRPVFVSRTRFNRGVGASKFAFEEILEINLQEAGYDVIYPETISLSEQLARYAAASKIIVTASTASHVVALAMTGHQDVAILQRFYSQADQFSVQMQAMGARKVVMLDHLSGSIRPIRADDGPGFDIHDSLATYEIDVAGLWSALIDNGFVTGAPKLVVTEPALQNARQILCDELEVGYGKGRLCFVPRSSSTAHLSEGPTPVEPPQTEAVRMLDLKEIIANCAALEEQPPDILASFTPPDTSKMSCIEINEAAIEELKPLGIRLVPEFGTGNRFYVDKSMPRIDIDLRFNGRSDNVVIMGSGNGQKGYVSIEGDRNLAVFGDGEGRRSYINAAIRFHDAALLFGKGSTAGGAQLWVEGPRRSLVVGDDCMFSMGIWIQTTDTHAIVDLDKREIINRSANISIGAHVWLGRDVLVMKGAKIGAGSIVGARSVVVRPLPPCCSAVGSPAKVVKTRISWTRHSQPDLRAIEQLRAIPSIEAALADQDAAGAEPA